MSGFVLNDKPVHEATIYAPRLGAWTIEAALGADEPLTGKVAFAADGITYRGTVAQGNVFNRTATVRIVGGGGGLNKPARPKHYRATSAAVVLQDLMAVSGDTLSSTADSAALARAIPSWSIGQDAAGTCIALLMARMGLSWRILPDGTLWAGAETWPATSAPDADVRVLERNDASSEMEVGLLSAVLRPGTTYQGRRISYVQTSISGSAVRARLTFEAGAGGSDVSSLLAELVRSKIPQLRHLAPVWAKVVAQAGSTIDVTPEDATYPPMAGVPLTVGVPGAKVNVAAGARVLVGWSGGDPRYPYVHGWDQSESVFSVAFDAKIVRHGGADASNGVAKGVETAQLITELGVILSSFVSVAAPSPPGAFIPNPATSTAIQQWAAKASTIPSTKVFTK